MNLSGQKTECITSRDTVCDLKRLKKSALAERWYSVQSLQARTLSIMSSDKRHQDGICSAS